jgi:hypothetical protein
MLTPSPPKQIGPIRRVISFVCAAALLAGGLYWLSDVILDVGGWLINGYHGPTTSVRGVRLILMVPLTMVITGAFWLWEDFSSRP